MKAIYWAVALSLLGVVPCGRAAADQNLTQGLRQPTSMVPTAYESGGYIYFSAEAAGESPSDLPAPATAPLPDATVGVAAACDTCGGSTCGQSCGQCACEPDAWQLCQPRCLSCRGITLGGWLEQGFTWNPDSPANRFNGPVTFNDRSNEYQLNQFDLFMERAVDTGGCGWDVGGRIDLLYGTDHRFTLSRGLEDNWNGDQRFYGLAMPQAYVDVAYNNLTVRLGHFYTILGYESVPAPNNFFYSHSYTMQYAEPFTHTGALFTYALNSRLSVSAGVDRGWNNWEDNNDKSSFLGGISWTSCSERTTLAFGLTSGDEDDAGQNNRTLFSFVLTQKLFSRLQYVLQTDVGWEELAANQGTQDAEWYGIVNYLYYELNPCWSFGIRYEWFCDDDGVRVMDTNAAGGAPHGMDLGGVPSKWNEISLGLNWKPNGNVLVRSEVRWDWVDPLITVHDGPYDDYNQLDQFLWGTDLIVTF